MLELKKKVDKSVIIVGHTVGFYLHTLDTNLT